MKKINNNIKIPFFMFGALFLLLTIFNCSADDEADNLHDSKLAYKVTGLNQCNSANGIGTQFTMSIFYVPPTGNVVRLKITQKSPNDGIWEFGHPFFTNKNNLISFTDCFRFDTGSWVEYEVIMVSSDGSRSNPFKIRINKPAGAN